MALVPTTEEAQHSHWKSMVGLRKPSPWRSGWLTIQVLFLLLRLTLSKKVSLLDYQPVTYLEGGDYIFLSSYPRVLSLFLHVLHAVDCVSPNRQWLFTDMTCVYKEFLWTLQFQSLPYTGPKSLQGLVPLVFSCRFLLTCWKL